MNRVPVSSSNVKSVGHDATNQAMDVEFVGGSLYRYYDVPLSVYENFLLCESKGKFLHSEIKGKYACVCLIRK